MVQAFQKEQLEYFNAILGHGDCALSRTEQGKVL